MFGSKTNSKKSKRGNPKRKNRKPPKSRRVEAPMDFDDSPNPNELELQIIKQTAGRANVVKIILVMVIIISPISMAIALRTNAGMRNVADQLGVQLRQVTEDKPGKQVALAEVRDWLDSDSSPFPKGTDSLIWDGAKRLRQSTDSNGTTTEWWTHTFSFVNKADGQTRQVTQLIEVQDGVPAVLGTPTILPESLTGDSSGTPVTPDGYQSVDQSTALTNTVESWAKAYIGTDPDALTVLVGDPNVDHAYQPAGVGTFKSASVNYAVWIDNDGNALSRDQVKAGDGKRAAVSATIRFTPTGGQSAQEVSTTITLLVTNPESGSARVVDWGADGDMTGLKPYAHAVSKDSVTRTDADDSQSQSTGPTSGNEPTDSATPSQSPTTDTSQDQTQTETPQP